MIKLTKNVVTFLLTAATGAGKTLLACLLTTKSACSILTKGVGNTNTTLTNRKYVYSTNEALKNKIIVWAKKKDVMLSNVDVQDVVLKALAILIAKHKDLTVMNTEELIEKFIAEGIHLLELNNNTRAIFTLLDDKELNDLLSISIGAIIRLGIINESYKVYKRAGNKIKPEEIKTSSHIFWSAIAVELSLLIDNIDNGTIHKQILFKNIKEKSDILEKKFYGYFGNDTINQEGYYVKEIDLENQDEEIISQLFKDNDLSKDKVASIEVLCDELIIYTYMNEYVNGVIKTNQKLMNIFLNNFNGYYEFALYDTMGVFHKDLDEDKSYDYFEGLTRIEKFAGIIVLAPLKGDSNVVKMKQNIVEFLSHIKYSTTIFILRNNLNKYIRDEIENQYDISTISDNDIDVDVNSMNEILVKLKKQLDKDFSYKQNKYIDLEVHKYLVEFRRFDSDIKRIDAISLHQLSNVVIDVLNSYANYVEKNNDRIKLTKDESADVSLYIDKDILKNNFVYLCTDIKNSNIEKEVFLPVNTNIETNLQKCPHGHSYNALKRHLSCGEGFTSSIDESYFVNRDNITITFPYNINKMGISSSFDLLIKNVVKIQGLVIDDLSMDKILDRFKKNINIYKITKLLVYDYALKDAEKSHLSYERCFNAMLDNCQKLVGKNGEFSYDKWVDALYEVYNEALNFTYNYGLLITN